KCRVEHRCYACGSVFRTLVHGKGVGEGIDKRDALASARELPEIVVEQNEPDVTCPSCGRLSTREIDRARSAGHRRLLGLFVFGLIVSGFVAANVSHGWAFCVPTGVAALAALGHLLTARWDPNADLARNRELLRPALSEGNIEIVTPSVTGRPPVDAPW